MSKAEKYPVTRKDSAPRTFDEPQPGWVPLQDASFHCTSTKLDTPASAVDELCQAIKKLLQPEGPPPPAFVGIDFTWSVNNNIDGVSFETTSADGRTIDTGFDLAGDLRTTGWHWVQSEQVEEWWGVLSENGKSHWDHHVPPKWREHAEVHRYVRGNVVRSYRSRFTEYVRDGRVHIMARPNVLAPFKRIMWDQWQFFKICEVAPRDTNQWQEPWWNGVRPLSAEGPSGERLYSIYAAPGTTPAVAAQGSLQDQLVDWFVSSIQMNPDRAPGGVDAFRRAAAVKFGAPIAIVRFALKRAQQITGNERWTGPGAPKKSPSIIPLA